MNKRPSSLGKVVSEPVVFYLHHNFYFQVCFETIFLVSLRSLSFAPYPLEIEKKHVIMESKEDGGGRGPPGLGQQPCLLSLR